MLDLRVAFGVAMASFGVPVTVRRPAPSATPIDTSGVWVMPVSEDLPPTMSVQRVSSKRVLWLPKADVPTVPRGTTIDAPISLGAPVQAWVVDGLNREEHDAWAVIVREAA